MKKQVKQFSPEYFQIAARTIRLKTWSIPMPTRANAYSMRTKWYQFVAALKAEGNITEWVEAIRVIAGVEGCSVTFTDRDETASAQLLRAAMQDEPISEIAGKMLEINKLFASRDSSNVGEN